MFLPFPFAPTYIPGCTIPHSPAASVIPSLGSLEMPPVPCEGVLEIAPWVCSRAEALPEGERQRFKRNRAIQPRTAEETRQGPKRPGGSLCCFPGSIPLQEGRKTKAHSRASWLIAPSSICPKQQQLLRGNKWGISLAEMG